MLVFWGKNLKQFCLFEIIICITLSAEGYQQINLCSKPTGFIKIRKDSYGEWDFVRGNCDNENAALMLYMVPYYMIRTKYPDGRYCYNALSYTQEGDDDDFSEFCMRLSNGFKVWTTSKVPVTLIYSAAYGGGFTMFYTMITNSTQDDSSGLACIAESTTARNGIGENYDWNYFKDMSPASPPTEADSHPAVDRILAISMGILLWMTLGALTYALLRNRTLKRILAETRSFTPNDNDLAFQNSAYETNADEQ